MGVAMWDLLNHSALQGVLGLVVLFAAIYIGCRIIMALRPATGKNDTNVYPLAENLEEMLREGDIDEAELRRIRAVLGTSQDTRASE